MYIRTVFPSVVALILYAAAVIAMGVFDVAFALLLAAYIFVLVAVLPYLSLRLTRRTNEEVKRERNGLYQKLTDAVMGIGDWVISGRTAEFLASYEQDEAAVARKDRKLRAWARWRSFIGHLVVGLVVISMVYWAGGETAAGRIDATLIAAFVLIVFPLSDAFLPVSEAVERTPQYRVSLDRLARISGEGASVSAPGDAVPAAAGDAVSRTADVRLRDVRFAYAAEDADSVDGVSLDLPQGKRVMVIGRSGAGKSTLLKLIQGALAPSHGTVQINGIPAAAYGDRMPEVISVLNQSPHLFDTTVANNIRLGRPAATDEEIGRAAQAAQLGPLVASLPRG